jgi:hypothetical protein
MPLRPDQLAEIRRMRHFSLGIGFTARTLGVTVEEVREAIRAGLPPLQRQERGDRDPTPTPEQLARRDVRSAAPARDLTGALMGDPPLGYSALDRRSAR